MATTLDFASPGPVTRSYRLVVHQYGFMKEQCRNGQPIEFPPFKAGDCSWCIYYYPNGRSTSSADYISIFIAGAGGRAATDEPVKARVTFSLLDRAGEPVPGHSCSGVWEYSKLDWYGCDLFIHKESLEASSSEYLVDDRLTIECVVSVERANDLQQRLSLDPDVTFQVGGEVFSVHSCVLAAKSLRCSRQSSQERAPRPQGLAASGVQEHATFCVHRFVAGDDDGARRRVYHGGAFAGSCG
jgi:speckle-type POZ protein